MPNRIRLILALHNHQPVGNFDYIFQEAFEDSYRPFLELFDRYESLKISLHTSGSLMEWLNGHHPEYIDRLAQLVEARRVEILGGAYFEPILAMIPSRDRVGQIRAYTRWLQSRMGATIRGFWVPERVWEPSFARDLVDAGIEYTVLDDFHFKCAGLTDSQLTGHLLTEDEGRLLSVFPGSERLRYLIPFAPPQATIEYLAKLAEEHPDAIAVFGDDGEKFGTWPETKKHVYDNGWLAQFFDALMQNQQWIQVTTLAEAFDNVPPLGKIYLPDCSYREMTEWSLPAEQLAEYERLSHEMQNDPRWPSAAAVRPRRLLAELQSEVPRVRRDVLANDDGQPPRAGRRRCSRRRRKDRRRAARTGPRRAVSRPVQLRLLAWRLWRHLSAPSPQRHL